MLCAQTSPDTSVDNFMSTCGLEEERGSEQIGSEKEERKGCGRGLLRKLYPSFALNLPSSFPSVVKMSGSC